MTATAQTDPTRVVGRRIVAFLIDFVILAGASIVLFAAMAPATSMTRTCPDGGDVGGIHLCGRLGETTYLLEGGKATAYLGLVVVLWLAYHGVLQGLAGATAGKGLLRVAVVDRSGNRAGVGRAAVRALPFALGAGMLGIGFALAAVVGLVMMLAHPRHRRVGDLVAGTWVVRRGAVGRLVIPDIPPVTTDVGTAPPG